MNKFCNLLYRIISLILIFSIGAFAMLLAAGCSSAESFTLYYGVNETPDNLDPQLASSDSEKLFVRNCFRGLYKLDSADNAVPDLVDNCDISADGLTYTFKLKNCEWSNEEKVTAHDFKFAVLRAADPQLMAPQTEYIKNIAGVSEHLSGINSEVGITALDDNTLIINLKTADKYFLQKLTNPVFMPCNEKFFIKCGGKYGLSKEHILTNGNYKVSSWPNEKTLELRRVAANTAEGASVRSVVLSESQTGKLNSLRIKNNEIGMTVVSGEDYSKIDPQKYTINTNYSKNYAIRFNRATTIGQNEALLNALAMGVDRVFVKENISDRFRTVYSCLPKDCPVLDTSTLEGVSLTDYQFQFSAGESRKEFLEAVKSFKNSTMPTVEILCPDDAEIKSILTNAVYSWQSNLGVVVNIKTVANDAAVLKEISSGSYSAAFMPLVGSAEEILTLLSSDYAQSEYIKTVNELNSCNDAEKTKPLIEKLCKILSTDPSVIPVVSVPNAQIYLAEYKNVYFSRIDGTVDFSIIYK